MRCGWKRRGRILSISGGNRRGRARSRSTGGGDGAGAAGDLEARVGGEMRDLDRHLQSGGGRAALEAGAEIVNDVGGLRDPAMAARPPRRGRA